MDATIEQQAHSLISQERFGEAASVLERELIRRAGDPGLMSLLAVALSHGGESDRAVDLGRRVTRQLPTHPGAWANLGLVLAQAGHTDDAVEAFIRSLSLRPEDINARVELCKLLNKGRRYFELVQAADDGLKLHRDHPNFVVALADGLAGLGRASEAVHILAHIAPHYPNVPVIHNQLAYYANYAETEPERVLTLHKGFGTSLAASHPGGVPIAASGPDRPLRLGFLSSDLGPHAISNFLVPILGSLGTSEFTTFGYALDRPRRRHEVSGVVAGALGTLRDMTGVPTDQVVEQIRADSINVLIDLNGLTSGGRPGVLAMRAAPVQITYLGYPSTTGVPNADYRLVDTITDPAGAEAYASEKLLRLDGCFVCYRPMEEPPEISPQESGRPVHFGSFNSLRKLSPELIAAWATVLGRVPGSRLVLKSPELGDSYNARDARGRLASAGIDQHRVDILPPTAAHRDHLATYSRIDVALDSFPYTGTTTTCEALMMGVPVVSYADPRPRHASRVGASLLTAAGLPELIATSVDQYVDKAAALAADPARIAGYRSGLRARVLGSPLCDAAGFARRFATAVRAAWRERCAG